MSATLTKAGTPAAGTVTVLQNSTSSAPVIFCADGTSTTGSLTLTPLSTTHDEDLDGCADWNELSPNQTAGGLRDPFNYWDYVDVSRDGQIRTVDITGMVQHYGHDKGDPLYGTLWDRGPQVPNADKWIYGAADDVIRTNEITAVVNSYGHDCPHLTSYTGIARMHDSITSFATGPYPLEAFPVGAVPSVDWPDAFPTSGQAHLGDELVNYTRSGSTFTIAEGGRGQGGTTATSHPAGTFVSVP